MADDRHYDPLLECLVAFAKLFHRPVTAESLIAGLPTEPGHGGPELFSIGSSKGMFSRVAARAGFAARLINRDIDHLSTLLLPCILVLKHRNACILESFDETRSRAKVIFPEVEGGQEWVDIDVLREQYLGFAFLLKPEYETEAREPMSVRPAAGGHWFWSTLGRSREIYASVVLGSIMVNLFALATPMFTMNVYDRVVPNHAIETLWVLALGVVTVYAFDAVLRSFRNYLIEVAGKKSDVIMSSLLFEQIMNLRMEAWPASVGGLASKLNQFESVRSFFTATTVVTLVDLPFTVIFLLAIGYIGDALVTIPLITIALLLLYGLLIVRPLRASLREVLTATADKNALLVESLGSIQTIKTLGASRFSQWTWEESTGRIATRSLRARLLSGSIGTVTSILVQLNMVGVVILGVYEIMDLNLTLGALIAVVILSSRAIAPMAQVAGLITNYQQTKAAFSDLEGLMALEGERSELKSYVRRPELDGKVELRGVDFTYPGAEKPSLRGINLSIRPGEHVGIIGKAGSGKTTIAKLLLGLYRPTGGSITVDDIDINQVDPADLRRAIGYLSQDVDLMRGTIRDSIVFKDPRVNDETMLAAAEVGGVDLFVKHLPRGYDTQLGERGYGLSGGQRQCVALARTLLLGESVVVLDEPTNSMDNITETAIRKRLYEHTRERTLVLITHKATMLELVERLVVVENGEITLDGPKDDVLKTLQTRSAAG